MTMINSSALSYKLSALSSKKIINMALLFFTAYSLQLTAYSCFAQDSDKLTALTKQIIEAKSNNDLFPVFESLTDLYFQENKYNEYAELLNSLISQKKNLEPPASYYIALTRYHQLKYLEEQQLWEEYFNRGNAYRQDLSGALKKAIDALPNSDPLSIYARLILWKFHKDQEGALAQDTLGDLVNATFLYAQTTDNIAPIKDVARELFAYGEKIKAREVYKIYADKISSSGIKDEEINAAALSFYNEGNLELAQDLYNIYIGKIETSYPKEKLIPILTDIAKLFAYSAASAGGGPGGKSEGPSDADYAEKMFKKIEEIAGPAGFDENLLYLRAFNLEKAKDYESAKNFYLELVSLFPQGRHLDEAEFKIGTIFVFVLGDIKNGRTYFERLAHSATLSASPELAEGLAARQNLSPQVISSLYELGLLYQWEGDYQKAKNYYNKLTELAKEGFTASVTATRERTSEINDAKPIEYNLRLFLDTCLKEESAKFNWAKADLKAAPVAKKNSDVAVTTNFSLGATGCMNVELQYLWSGDTGKLKPSSQQGSFSTQYAEAGTKIIALIVVSPGGVAGKDISLVDIE